jgi:15-cis-phytoene synthase
MHPAAVATVGALQDLAVPAIGPTAHIIPTLPGLSEAQLAASFAECARITRTRARNFFHGLRLTPEPRRSAIYSIYAWMRAADDEADSPADLREQHARLAEYRAKTEHILAGNLPGKDWPAFWLGIAATIRSYPLEHAIFRDMLAGLDEDLGHAPYGTDADLSRYCYRVAGTAGLACVGVWGLRPGACPDQARDLALRRGQAFQRTNILRDFAQDFDQSPQRVYIPADALSAAGLTAPELREWNRPDACQAVVRAQAAIAIEHYRVSDQLITLIDPACAPTLWAMTRIYSGLLEIILADPASIVSDRRIRLSGVKKARIALTAAIGARVGKW